MGRMDLSFHGVSMYGDVEVVASEELRVDEETMTITVTFRTPKGIRDGIKAGLMKTGSMSESALRDALSRILQNARAQGPAAS